VFIDSPDYISYFNPYSLNNNKFIPNFMPNCKFYKQLCSFNLYNGGCSLTVERTVVVRVARVRLPPSACKYKLNLKSKMENKEGGRNLLYFVKNKVAENICSRAPPSACKYKLNLKSKMENKEGGRCLKINTQN
jgi:hypothetical protein